MASTEKNITRYYLCCRRNIAPAPYSFHCLKFFLGCTHCIFILRFKKKEEYTVRKKRVGILHFFEKKETALTNRILPFCYLCNSSMLGCSFVIICGIIIHIQLNYFA
uniref:Uncharacterized protein n=1 Tax=Erwinia amylovora TaxID=552 RepID=Q4R0I4_ERWAM|nr:hypothetical protein [Erwinia amylovora]